ncbi:MAG: M6 family metalloprotease domain-containing protein [Prevotella sp.]|uniref:M6 family metalloprotease domain-containing protein n=1 Tax=Prevotella pectinovora TaxID=1602169 RepID=UPI002432254B|nr:M6 family metalloprotease domain-containing protein [Prevotella pectinovora]MCI6048863.1 M6 family metalloprotease domain-containing protein [Prevotella pectinovora]MCI6336402.1 M6 family metalloprotease domain-containing protein [Prevotella sp.]MEE1546995.1 M6 family metalloprotease domain-containing protein [Prevotella pectinovora]
MRKKLLFGLLFAAMTAGAVKMKPGINIIKQADGTTITVRAYGDEDLSYFLASDGTLLYQEGTNFYIAGVKADGTLYSTGVLAHEPSMRTIKEISAIKAQNAKAFYNSMETQAKANKVRREPMTPDNSLLPSLGKHKIPVILVEFSDVEFSVENPKATFDKYLNGKELFNKETDPEMGQNYAGVAKYFKDMSFGKFEPEFEVYGPVNLGKPLATYGAGYSSQENMGLLLTDACTAVDDEVDFTQYDSNDDGNIDLIYIIYAGFSQSIAGNSTDCIHPKSGYLSLAKSFDGMDVKRYGVNNELNGTPADQANGPIINGIGLFCHEFSHCMGLPDLYPKSGSIAEACINQNMDYWSLMDAGEYTANGYRPTAYTAWERERLGWMEIGTLTGPSNVELKSLDEGGAAFRIYNDKDETGHEYYIVENVQNNGWNKNLFGNGLMVTHVDYLSSQFSLGGCKVNNTEGHPRMHVMAADGMFVPEYFLGSTIEDSYITFLKEHNADLVAKYGGQVFSIEDYKAEAAGDLFPGTSNATSLTDDSQPMKAWTYNGETMGKPITDITNDTEKGIVSFKFMGGGEPVDGINEVTVNKTTDSRVYSISGTYMGNDINSLPKGIYIRNGKKVINN